jgi:ComF family protein
MIGNDLIQSYFSEVDIIVPVPLHKSRLRKRGYNQSDFIAAGIAEALGKDLDTKTLYRAIANPTQTKKHRYDRWTNVEGIFALKNPQHLANKHILLVDDIVTTGATLESCAATILGIGSVEVSIVAMAMA